MTRDPSKRLPKPESDDEVAELARTLDQMLSLRPRNRFEDLEGVYLVGGGTHPGSGLPVIFQSARISAQLLADDLGVANAWGRRDGRPRPVAVRRRRCRERSW